MTARMSRSRARMELFRVAGLIAGTHPRGFGIWYSCSISETPHVDSVHV